MRLLVLQSPRLRHSLQYYCAVTHYNLLGHPITTQPCWLRVFADDLPDYGSLQTICQVLILPERFFLKERERERERIFIFFEKSRCGPWNHTLSVKKWNEMQPSNRHISAHLWSMTSIWPLNLPRCQTSKLTSLPDSARPSINLQWSNPKMSL